MTLFPSFKTTGTVLLKAIAFWILLVAAYLALGRQFFPYVDRYQNHIASILGDRLGAEVSIGQLTGQWQQFNPVLIAEDIRVGETARVDRLVLEPSVIQSLVTLSPVFKRFELQGFVADLEQRDEGWQLAGLSAAGERLPLERLTALLRQQREVHFRQVELNVQPSRLPSITVIMDDGQLTGAGEDNWLLANARVIYDALEVPIELQMESTRADDRYNVDVYARHGSLDFAPWLTTRWPKVARLDLAGEYWVSLRNDYWEDLTVRLFSEQTRLAGGAGRFNLADVQTELYAERKNGGFDAWINHLGHRMTLDDARQTYPFGTAVARLSRRHTQWQLQWDRLPVAPLSAWLALDDTSGFWREAFPTGAVNQGKLSFNTEQWQSLRLTAQVADAAMRPYAGIPGFGGVGGQARVEGPVARLVLDNDPVDLTLPRLYEEAFLFERLEGVVEALWWPGTGVQLEGRHQARVAPTPDQAGQGERALPVEGSWQVGLPIAAVPDPDREVGFRLALEAPSGSLGWVKRLTPNGPLDPAVTDWIDGNIMGGDFRDISFVFGSGFSNGSMTENSLSLDAAFSNAQVRFHDDWPAVEQGTGRLQVGNERLRVAAESGRLGGMMLSDGRLELPYGASRVDIDTGVSGPAESVLDLFQTGPLAMLGEGVVDGWQAGGAADGRLSLSIPLGGEPPSVSVHGHVERGRLYFPEQNLTIEEIEGDLNYTDAEGLYAGELSGDVFGQPHRANLITVVHDSGPAVELEVNGETPLAAWGDWLGDAWLGAQPFHTPAQARLRFAAEGTEIHLRTNLVNVPLDFPPPLAKPAAEARPLDLRVSVDTDGRVTLNGRYDERLNAHLVFDAARQVESGTVALNRPLQLRDEAGVFFDATLAEAEIDRWWQAIQGVVDHYPAVSGTSAGDPDWIREINLDGERWRYLGMGWSRPSVQVQRNEEAWLVRFESRETQGRVLIPHDEAPLFVDVSFLALADGNEEPAREGIDITLEDDPLSHVQADEIPDMNIQIAQLSMGERDFGSWRAEVVGAEQVISARNIRGDVPGAQITGTLTWDNSGPKARTDFSGTATTGNINTLLRSWDYAPVLVSTNGQFDLDLDWAGSPAVFSFNRLEGRIGLRLNQGSILELEEYEGVKLIGLLNFTRVLRRLALDFSDLIQDGITYDVIEGELLFDRGFARVGERLVIDGPAMKFRFTGDADLIRDALDVDMVMTVPLSSTVPLVALLAGVSPQAAAAIYVTERVFNNELERLSSARMHVGGSLDEPELRFYRVFDNSGGRQGPSVGERLKNVVPVGTGN